MVKNKRELRMVKKMETPELDKFTTTSNTNNKKKKPQQRRENNSATDNAAATTATTKSVNKHSKEHRDIETSIFKLRYGSAEQDNDDDDDDFEDDEEAEESETDLLDEDDDVDEATLLLSSDEEEFLETQRISLPELIVKKLLHTTTTTTSPSTLTPTPMSTPTACAATKQNGSKSNVSTKQQKEKKDKPTVESEVENKSTDQKEVTPKEPKTEKVNEVHTGRKQESKKSRIDDFPRPMLLPKLENVDVDIKETAAAVDPALESTTTLKITNEAKRRRGRPPKSKLTEANVQAEATTDKQAKLTAISPTPSAATKLTVLGHISYNAQDKSLIFQCMLCNLSFVTGLNGYTQHLRSSHQMLRYLENPVMVIIPQRKSTRAQQDQQQKDSKATSTATETNDQINNIGLKLEVPERGEQPKDDKENIISQLNNRHVKIERDHYYACGMVTLYNDYTISFICKYCEYAQTQEELFLKHILMEHQILVAANEKSTTPISTIPINDDVVEDDNNTMVALKPSGKLNPNAKQNAEKRCISNNKTDSTERLAAAKAPETPPPEESEEEREKNTNEKETIIEHEPLPPTTLDGVKLAQEEHEISLERNVLTENSKKSCGEEEQMQAEPQQVETQKEAEKDEKDENDEKDEKVAQTNAAIDVQQCKVQQTEAEAEVAVVQHAEDTILQNNETALKNEVLDTTKSTAQPKRAPKAAAATPQGSKTRQGKRKKILENTKAVAEQNVKRPTRRGRPRQSQIATELKKKKQAASQLKNIETTTELITSTTKSKRTTTTTKSLSNESTTTLPTQTTRKRRTVVAKDSKKISAPKKEKKDINTTVGSAQVQEQKQSESTPSTSTSTLSPETIVSTKTTRRRRRNEVHEKREDADATKIEKPEETDETDEREEKVEDSINTNSNPGNEYAYSCKICTRSFKKWCRLAEHIRLHTGELPYKCDKCEKRFRCKQRLMEHLTRHLGIKPFQCDVCNLSMATKQDLAQHKRYHTGIRPHVCSHCQKAFVRKSDLIIHLRIHTGEKPYVCEICKHSFRANQNLYLHRKTHLGKKDYICDICKKGFLRKIDLRIHTRTHTGEKPYKCEICGRGFSSKFNVRTHIERLHVANSNGIPPKKVGRKSNALRAELERQKALIEELRNQLDHRIKTEEEKNLQQQQLLVLPTTTTTTSASCATTIKLTASNTLPVQQQENQNDQSCSNQQAISIANFELPMPMYGMPTAIQMPTTTISNSIGGLTSPSTSISISTATATATLSPQSQSQSQSELQKNSSSIIDSIPLNTLTPVSILAVVTAQPHGSVNLNNLPSDSIKATTLPLHIQLTTPGSTSSKKKERKITSYFNVMGQKT